MSVPNSLPASPPRAGPLDLSGGIPLDLWTGADEATRRLLFREYQRQLDLQARHVAALEVER